MTPTDPSRPEQVDAIDTIDNDSIDAGTPSTGLRRGLLTAAVVALALTAAGAAGAALARGGGSDGEAALAAATSSPTPSGDERGPDKDGRHGPGGRFGHHLFGGPGGGALHGSFVVPDGDGGFTTMLTQHGTASKVGDTPSRSRARTGSARPTRSPRTPASVRRGTVSAASRAAPTSRSWPSRRTASPLPCTSLTWTPRWAGRLPPADGRPRSRWRAAGAEPDGQRRGQRLRRVTRSLGSAV